MFHALPLVNISQLLEEFRVDIRRRHGGEIGSVRQLAVAVYRDGIVNTALVHQTRLL